VPNPVLSLHAQLCASAAYEHAKSKLMLLPSDSENDAQLGRCALVGLCGHDGVVHFHPSFPPHRQTSLPYSHLNLALPQAVPAVGCASGQTPQPNCEQVRFA
jgi:hypothetical protein